MLLLAENIAAKVDTYFDHFIFFMILSKRSQHFLHRELRFTLKFSNWRKRYHLAANLDPNSIVNKSEDSDFWIL